MYFDFESISQILNLDELTNQGPLTFCCCTRLQHITYYNIVKKASLVEYIIIHIFGRHHAKILKLPQFWIQVQVQSRKDFGYTSCKGRLFGCELLISNEIYFLKFFSVRCIQIIITLYSVYCKQVHLFYCQLKLKLKLQHAPIVQMIGLCKWYHEIWFILLVFCHTNFMCIWFIMQTYALFYWPFRWIKAFNVVDEKEYVLWSKFLSRIGLLIIMVRLVAFILIISFATILQYILLV